MKKGDLVVKVISIMGIDSATLERVVSVKKGVVKIEGAQSLSFRADGGREIDPAIPNCFSRLIELDGGEQDRIESGHFTKD